MVLRVLVVLSLSLTLCVGSSASVQADAAEDAYKEGARLMQEGHLGEAIEAFDKALRLNPRSATSYNGRGVAFNELAQNQRALKDYDAALAIDDKYTEAYFNRGNAYADLGQYERAIQDYNQAILLTADYSGAYFNRSLAYMALGKSEVAADARSYLNLKGWKDDRAMYMIIFGSFGDRWAGREADAQQLLKEATEKCDTAKWPYPIIRYLRRDISAQELLAEATDLDKKTEARTYIGLDLLLAAKRGEALTQLEWVTTNGNRGFSEYEFATRAIQRTRANK